MGEGRKEGRKLYEFICIILISSNSGLQSFYLISSAYLLSCILHAVSLAILNLLHCISYKCFFLRKPHFN